MAVLLQAERTRSAEMKISDELNKYTIKDATHLLKCCHAINPNRIYYVMNCIVLKKTKAGKLKVLVFGDRYWKGHEDKKQIRYVNEFKVKKNYRSSYFFCQE